MGFDEKDCVYSSYFSGSLKSFIFFRLLLCNGLPNLPSFQICWVLTFLVLLVTKKLFLSEIPHECGMLSNNIFRVCACGFILFIKNKHPLWYSPLLRGREKS